MITFTVCVIIKFKSVSLIDENVKGILLFYEEEKQLDVR